MSGNCLEAAGVIRVYAEVEGDDGGAYRVLLSTTLIPLEEAVIDMRHPLAIYGIGHALDAAREVVTDPAIIDSLPG